MNRDVGMLSSVEEAAGMEGHRLAAIQSVGNCVRVRVCKYVCAQTQACTIFSACARVCTHTMACMQEYTHFGESKRAMCMRTGSHACWQRTFLEPESLLA